jgi:hypothetical protein
MIFRFFCPLCLRPHKLTGLPRCRLVKCLTCGKWLRLSFRVSARLHPFYVRSRN